MKIISYEKIYFDKLKTSYEEVFKRGFIEKEIYESRFCFNKKFSSYLLIDNNSKVIGHIGFKIHKFLNFGAKNIAFRFSTFLNNSFRGIGLYKEFMDYVKSDLKKSFEVDFIYAWPNKINLLSCLKDKDYINLNPIITWQHYLGFDDFNYKKVKDLNYEDFVNTSLDYLIKPKLNYLTYDTVKDLKIIFKDRVNKKYKIVFFNREKFAILGFSNIEDKIYISIVFNNNLEISNLLNILNYYHSNQNVIVQSWCFYKDYSLLRELIKSNFKNDGPIFYNGVYELGVNKFPINKYFPSMYNHDAF